jgi:hypothetical protein
LNLQSAITLYAYGTSQGVEKAWDTRGRGRNVLPRGTKYLYHGTSTKFIDGIKTNGLTSGKNYVTPSAALAHTEAGYKTHGDPNSYGSKDHRAKGSGGKPVVVVIDANHPSLSLLKRDKEFEDKDIAFYTRKSIHPSAVVGIYPIDKFVQQIRRGKLTNDSDNSFKSNKLTDEEKAWKQQIEKEAQNYFKKFGHH